MIWHNCTFYIRFYCYPCCFDKSVNATDSHEYYSFSWQCVRHHAISDTCQYDDDDDGVVVVADVAVVHSKQYNIFILETVFIRWQRVIFSSIRKKKRRQRFAYAEYVLCMHVNNYFHGAFKSSLMDLPNESPSFSNSTEFYNHKKWQNETKCQYEQGKNVRLVQVSHTNTPIAQLMKMMRWFSDGHFFFLNGF